MEIENKPMNDSEKWTDDKDDKEERLSISLMPLSAEKDSDDELRLVSVRLHGTGRPVHALSEGITILRGDHLIIDTGQGEEIGVASDWSKRVKRQAVEDRNYSWVIRLASNDDLRHFEENKVLEKRAEAIAREKIEQHGLEMSLVSVQYGFDNRKITFFFTAEGRVDFRDLVRDLASVFHTRIELRQIGVRDETAMIGGLGTCGRELCCCSFLTDFKPVSIRMAKDQNLAMNPGKISGMCGRLLCCLAYEHDAYLDAKKRLPRKNANVMTPDGPGVVKEIHLLQEKLTVALDGDDDTTEVVVYDADDVRVEQKHGESDKGSSKKRQSR